MFLNSFQKIYNSFMNTTTFKNFELFFSQLLRKNSKIDDGLDNGAKVTIKIRCLLTLL